jgi:hypothetical protein
MHTFKILDYEYKTEGGKLLVDFKYKFEHVGDVFTEHVEFPLHEGKGILVGTGPEPEANTQTSTEGSAESSKLNIWGGDLKFALDHYALMAGVSYFKFFPDAEIVVDSKKISIYPEQIEYLNTVYKNGLGEFWFVNKLDPEMFVGFGERHPGGGRDPLTLSQTESSKDGNNKNRSESVQAGESSLISVGPGLRRDDNAFLGDDAQTQSRPNFVPWRQGPQDFKHDWPTKVLVLQSGGKDSLVTAQLVREKGLEFDSLYVTNKSAGYPEFLNESSKPGKLLIGSRTVALSQNELMLENGGHLGHVPFSAIYAAYSSVVAVMGDYTHILASLESSSKEGNEMIGDLVVNHQWSKSLVHEKMFNELISKMYVRELSYGSIIRPFTELKIAELFVEKCFDQFGYKFSSCNQANYIQGHDPSSLGWCLNCAKCANAALLFAPFLEREKLEKLFSGNPFKNTNLTQHFIDLLGQGAHKPFECVAEIDELKMAYNMALQREPDYLIEGLSPVEVPVYDYLEEHEHSSIVETLGFYN